MQRLNRAVVSAAVAAAMLLFNTVPVFAACSPGRPVVGYSGFAGTQGSINGVRGIDADIEEYHPYASSGSESLMWVMLNIGTTRWAQVGWWQDVTTHYVFEQHTDNTGHWFTNWWPGEVTTLTDYRVTVGTNSNGSGNFNFYVRGALRSTVSRIWSPTGYQVYGETHRKADQMAGGYSSQNTQAVFSVPEFEDSTAAWVHVITPAGVNNTTFYGAQFIPSQASYYIWDNACPS